MGNPQNTSSSPAERDLDAKRANRDPITGAPGAHPVGTGVGAGTGGAVGLGIGAAVGGPVGAVVGAAIGAVAGGLSGKAAAEVIDPTVEDAYWRSNYKTRPYVDANTGYDVYAPAYRFGWENRMKQKDGASKTFEHVENDLAQEWTKASAKTSLGWEKAKHAVRDAWDRIAVDRAEGEGMTGGTSPECCGGEKNNRDATRQGGSSARPR